MLEARGLCKSFGKVVAVRGVSFSARDGQITGLLGPNGAGKSTTPFGQTLQAAMSDFTASAPMCVASSAARLSLVSSISGVSSLHATLLCMP